MSKYIVLEGADGLGKSTQINNIVEHLTRKKHEECVAIREPGITANNSDSFPEALRRLIMSTSDLSKEEELLLLDAIRLYNTRKYIQPALDSGVYLVSDRCFISSLVYQTLPINKSKDYMERIKTYIGEGKLILPDLVIFLTLNDEDDVKPIVNRIKHRSDNNRFDSEQAIDIQNKIRDYNYIIKHYVEPLCPVVTIKADKSLEEVTSEVLKAIDQHT